MSNCTQTNDEKRSRVVDLGIEKGRFRASVSPGQGAALTSIVMNIRESIELIYDKKKRGHIEGWEGLAPWLWPAVGRTLTEGEIARAEEAGVAPIEGHYALRGVYWPMPIHGFVSSRPWAFVGKWSERTYSRAVCRFKDDAQTRRLYPFGFELESITSVFPSEVIHALKIHASPENEYAMPFSVGNHITLDITSIFRKGLEDIVLRSPCRFEFPLMNCGVLDGRRVETSIDGVPLSDLVNRVVGGYEKDKCWVDIEGDNLTLRISQSEVSGEASVSRCDPDAMVFVFYGIREKGFFCPEPWLGLPNSLNTGSGITTLLPGEDFQWQMTIHI